MDCREWEEQLDDLLEGRLDQARRDAAEAHAAGCDRCGDLLALARGDRPELADLANLAAAVPPDAPDLTAAILARTSGSACGRAGELLASLSDDTPALGDAQLLHAHLDHCPRCRAIAATLAWLAPELRAMAEVEPAPGFLAGVLAATATLRDRAVARAARRTRLDRAFAPVESVVGRAVAWWQRQLRRPQFALEFAYVGTMILLALCATPISPLRGAPGQALAVVKASPAGLATASAWVWNALPERVTASGRVVWDATGGRIEASLDLASVRFATRARATAPLRADVRLHLADTGRALLNFDFVQAAAHWDEARASVAVFWRAWRAWSSVGGAADRVPPAGDPRARV